MPRRGRSCGIAGADRRQSRRDKARIVPDLHDGAQRYVVNPILTLKLARAALENGDDTLGDYLEEALGAPIKPASPSAGSRKASFLPS